MKTNLDLIFKTDTDLENTGVWFEVSEKTSFLIKRFGGNNSTKVKAAFTKHYKPFAKMVEMGTLPAAKESEILNRVFVESCMTDWKGVEIDGVEVPFDTETAIKLLISLPELSSALIKHASDIAPFKEDVGNS